MLTAKEYRKKVPVWVRCILAAPFVALLAFCLYIAYWMIRLDARLEEKRSTIRAAGYPVTVLELADYYSEVRAGENAAPGLLAAYSELERIDPGAKRLKEFYESEGRVDDTTGVTTWESGELQAYVDEVSSVLSKLGDATAYQDAHFATDFSMGYGMPLTHLPELRALAQLAGLASESALLDGDYSRATSWQARVLQIGSFLEREPILISQLVRLRINEIGTKKLERMLSVSSLSEAQLSLLCRAYTDAEYPEGLRLAFVGERCMSTGMVHGMYSPGSEVTDERVLTARADVLAEAGDRALVFLKWQELRCYSFFDSLIPIGEPDWPGIASSTPPSTSGLIDRYSFVDTLLQPLHRARLAFVKDAALLRLAQSAIAVERYRLAKGRLPVALSDCVPVYLDAVPDDPFDGQPIRFRLAERGYLVYSVSIDLDDDSGMPSEKWRPGGIVDGDLVFSVTR